MITCNIVQEQPGKSPSPGLDIIGLGCRLRGPEEVDRHQLAERLDTDLAATRPGAGEWEEVTI